MYRFWLLIVSILLLFLFLIPGTPFAGIVPGPELMIGQANGSPMVDCKAGAVNHLFEASALSLTVAIVTVNYLSNRSYRHNAIDSPEGGTVLKCPILWAH